MRKVFLISFILFWGECFAQTDTTKWLRAFPVTNYMVDLNDSIKVVQLQMPDGYLIKEKQLGLVRGVYFSSHDDTVQKGYGRCNLIKGEYYYFSIGHNASGVPVKEGDLLYTFVDRVDIYYGRIPKLASHFIQLQDVYEKPFYDNYAVFSKWTEAGENSLIDSIVKDIQFTGNYFLQNNPAMDKMIAKGAFKDKKLFTVMIECLPANVKDFIDYVIARPRLYAGRKWKVSEVFATWIFEGAPAIVRD